ncbi:hypothetical protein Bbelb_121010 [Branchiostoma belcheri]|nr:hypothetical protein Bbelb_121010 [Branchiostoma belcheri]
MGKPAGVLMFLLVILKVLGTAETCRCTASSCNCRFQGLTSVPQDLPTNITRLDLGFDRITTLRLGNLEYLNLNNNDISDIQAGTFSATPQLEWLSLNNNKLTSLRSDMFTGLGNLEGLYLNNNDISDIQAGTFNSTPKLTTLLLHFNKLRNLRSDMFTGLGNLEGLHLNNNDISDIQAGTFNPTPQLRRLHLSDNKLTSLRSDMFTGLGNLEVLQVQYNDITDIQAGTFNSTPQLRSLNLRNNQIQTIPSNLLTNLMQLRFLKLSDNSITMFPFEDLARLQRLDLYNNQITTLPSVAYDILSSISDNSVWRDVNIGNNPWQCDCRMVDFRLKMTGSYPFENQITCSQPDSLHGLKLKHVSPEDLICEDPTTGLMSPVTSPPPTTVATEIPEPNTVQNSSITSSPVSGVFSPSKQTDPALTLSLPALLGAVFGSVAALLSTYEKEYGKVKHTALPVDQPPAVVHCTTVCRPRATEMDMGTTLRSA